MDDIESTMLQIQKAVGAVSFAQAIRQFGHLEAQIDPLGNPRPGDPELSPEFHGVQWEDLHGIPASLIGGPIAGTSKDAFDAVNRLLSVYCGGIGYDNDHIRIPGERNWLREAAESGRYRFSWSQAEHSPSAQPVGSGRVVRAVPAEYLFDQVPLLDRGAGHDGAAVG